MSSAVERHLKYCPYVRSTIAGSTSVADNDTSKGKNEFRTADPCRMVFLAFPRRTPLPSQPSSE